MRDEFLFLCALAFAAAAALVVTTGVAARLHRRGFPVPAEDRRIGCVDGLRGYLALFVMIHHAYLWIHTTRFSGTWTAPEINFLNQLGAGAVALFFMTTGLVFYPRIRRGVLGNDWPAIYISRVFRILPLVGVSFGAVTAIVMLRTGVLPDASYLRAAASWISAWSEPDILGYVDSARINASVLWSLKFEWIFYLALMPACAVAMEIALRLKLPSWSVPAAFLTGVLALRSGLALRGLHPLSLQYISLFPIGMLALEIRDRKSLAERLSGPVGGAAALIALAVGMVATRFPYCVSLPLFAFFFITVACGHRLFGLLSTKGAQVLGECSFGVYVLHGVLLDIVFVDFKPAVALLPTPLTAALLPVMMGVTVLIAAAAHLWIERPMIAAGKHLARRVSDMLRAKSPAPAPPRTG